MRALFSLPRLSHSVPALSAAFVHAFHRSACGVCTVVGVQAIASQRDVRMQSKRDLVGEVKRQESCNTVEAKRYTQ
jgi:hypothetical protein